MTTRTPDLPLWRATPARARRTDPPTSHEAAASVDTTELEALVVRTLRAHPQGLTSHQVAEITGESLVTISPRMKPLETKGLVERAGESNRRTIWRAI